MAPAGALAPHAASPQGLWQDQAWGNGLKPHSPTWHPPGVSLASHPALPTPPPPKFPRKRAEELLGLEQALPAS